MTDKPKTIQEALMKVRENAQLINEQQATPEQARLIQLYPTTRSARERVRTTGELPPKDPERENRMVTTGAIGSTLVPAAGAALRTAGAAVRGITGARALPTAVTPRLPPPASPSTAVTTRASTLPAAPSTAVTPTSNIKYIGSQSASPNYTPVGGFGKFSTNSKSSITPGNIAAGLALGTGAAGAGYLASKGGEQTPTASAAASSTAPKPPADGTIAGSEYGTTTRKSEPAAPAKPPAAPAAPKPAVVPGTSGATMPGGNSTAAGFGLSGGSSSAGSITSVTPPKPTTPAPTASAAPKPTTPVAPKSTTPAPTASAAPVAPKPTIPSLVPGSSLIKPGMDIAQQRAALTGSAKADPDEKESGPDKKEKKKMSESTLINAFLRLQETKAGNVFEAAKKAKKLADKDYDGDGKIESPKDEVWGSRMRAAKAAGKMEESSCGCNGNCQCNVKEDVQQDAKKPLGASSSSERIKDKLGITPKSSVDPNYKPATGASEEDKAALKKKIDDSMKEEVEQIDEISSKLASRAAEIARNRATMNADDGKPAVGMAYREQSYRLGLGAEKRRAKEQKAGLSSGKRARMEEEVEQIDEIDKKTLMRYIPAAADDLRLKYHKHMGNEGLPYGHREAMTKKADKIRQKRLSGIAMATDKLAREEVEQIDEVFDPTSKAHRAASKTTRSFKGKGLRAEYHPDGSATIHVKDRDDGISATRLVDHHFDIHKMGYNRSADDYANFTKKSDNGLTHTSKKTPNGYIINISSNEMKEEVDFSEAELAHFASVLEAMPVDQGKTTQTQRTQQNRAGRSMGDTVPARDLTDEYIYETKKKDPSELKKRGRKAGSTSGSIHGDEAKAEPKNLVAQNPRSYNKGGKNVVDLEHPSQKGVMRTVPAKEYDTFRTGYLNTEKPADKQKMHDSMVDRVFGKS